jgi:hypothetical protein
MRLLAVCLCLCLLMPGCVPRAEAGAWPRKAGTGFASADVRLSWPKALLQGLPGEMQQYYTLYVEYGLTDRWTLGLDLGRSVSGAGKTVVFLQYPLRDRDRGAKITAQLGFGKISGQAVVRPGLALGWGRPRGWASAEAVAEVQIDSGATDLKLDLTLGVNLFEEAKWIVQLQTGAPQGAPDFARAASSVILPLRGGLKAEAGVTWGLQGDDSFGLKLGLWKDF